VGKRVITKQLAEGIAKKLGAVLHPKKNRPHDLYVVSYQGRQVASFGIRRAREKDKGHDHIPGQIYLSPHDAKLFGQCEHTYDYWVEKMREKGIIPPEPDQTQ
jgi:hypothetical protein